MSFILSALKKVENKRNLGAAPDISAIQVQSYDYADNHRYRISVVLATIGVTAVVIFTGLWLYKTLPEPIATEPNIPTRIATPSAADTILQTDSSPQINRPPVAATPPSAAAAVPPSVVRNNLTPAAQTYYPPAQQPAINNATVAPQLYQNPVETPDLEPLPVGIVNYEELPNGLRKRIPNIQLSAHIHSDLRPQARKVIINGVALREGQRLSDDLTVHQINADGAVMDFQGTLFLLGKNSIFN
ncbi:MAG: general secretion pathway protein GspB [Chromatiales bacterium]|nr:general secretion pathway protein GspB [Chromatiales bacterium]